MLKHLTCAGIMGGLRLKPEQSARLVGARKRLLTRLGSMRQARESAVMAFSLALIQQPKVSSLP